MKKENSIETEKVPIFWVYKQGDDYICEWSEDSNKYEIYGYLKTFVASLGKSIRNGYRAEKTDEDNK